jgi:sporulation protein YlmC with PRC-barrel domain
MPAIALGAAAAGRLDPANVVRGASSPADTAPAGWLMAQAQGVTQPPIESSPAQQTKTDDPAAQSVRVADLVGSPIRDAEGSILGHVRAVARTREGKIQLLLPLGGLFGFGERLVAIPIEAVAMLGRQVVVVDIPPDRFQKSPTWYGSNSETLAATETVRVAKR